MDKISTTITKKFFEMKMHDLEESGYFMEFKEFKRYWIKRLDDYNSNHDDLNVEIVFLVGAEPHRFKAISIWKVCRDFIPEEYQSAITTEYAYAIKCVCASKPSLEATCV